MQITYLRKDNIVTSIFNDDVELIANDKLGVCRVDGIPTYDTKREYLKVSNVQEQTEKVSKIVYNLQLVKDIDENGVESEREEQVPETVIEDRKYYTCDLTVVEDTERINQYRIAELKKMLANTNYKAIKYAEGEITAEEYAETKAKRKAWRDEINSLESK